MLTAAGAVVWKLPQMSSTPAAATVTAAAAAGAAAAADGWLSRKLRDSKPKFEGVWGGGVAEVDISGPNRSGTETE